MQENQLTMLVKASLIYKNGTRYGVYVSLVGIDNGCLIPNGTMVNENYLASYYYSLSYIKRKNIFYDANYERGEIVTKEYTPKKKIYTELSHAFLFPNMDVIYDLFHDSFINRIFRFQDELSYGVDFDKDEIVYETMSKFFVENSSKEDTEKLKKEASRITTRLRKSDYYLYAFFDFKTLINDWLNSRLRIVKTHFIDVYTHKRVDKDSIFRNKEIHIQPVSRIFNKNIDEMEIRDNKYCVEVPIKEGEETNSIVNCSELNCEGCLNSDNRKKSVYTEFLCCDFFRLGIIDRSIVTRLILTRETIDWLRNNLLNINIERVKPCRIIYKDSLDSCIINELQDKTKDDRFSFFTPNGFPNINQTIRFIPDDKYKNFKESGTLELFTDEMLQKKQIEYAKNCLMGRRRVDFIKLVIDDDLNVDSLDFEYTDKTDFGYGMYHRIRNIQYCRKEEVCQ